MCHFFNGLRFYFIEYLPKLPYISLSLWSVLSPVAFPISPIINKSNPPPPSSVCGTIYLSSKSAISNHIRLQKVFNIQQQGIQGIQQQDGWLAGK